MATFGVRGGIQVANVLKGVARDVVSPAIRRKARQAAMRPVLEAARDYLSLNGSVQTGALAASLGIAESDRVKNRTLMGVRRGTFRRHKPIAYAHFVEWGTAPHFQPNRFGGIWHPGARPKPFLRPALYASEERIAEVYGDVMRAEIQAAAQRLAGRSVRRR